MKLQNLRDLIMAEVNLGFTRYGIKPTLVEDKLVMAWISAAQQDLFFRLQPSKNYTTFQVFKGTNTYSLPVDFGSIDSVVLENARLNYTPFNKMEIEAEGVPHKFSIWHKDYSRITFSPIPNNTYDVTVWYNVGVNIYDPTETGAQTFGTFDGNQATGDIKVPDRYTSAIVRYCLSRVFMPEHQMYEYEVNKLKQIEVTMSRDEVDYRLGL